MEKYIREVIQPKLQADGGWVEYISFEFNTLKLIFRGECSKCLILDRCIDWIKSEVKRDLGFDIEIEAQRVKPFFWDK